MALPPTTLPWYRSHVIVAALVSILTKALVATGMIDGIAPEDETQLVSLIVLVIGGVADIWVMRSRIVQKYVPDITVKKEN